MDFENFNAKNSKCSIILVAQAHEDVDVLKVIGVCYSECHM